MKKIIVMLVLVVVLSGCSRNVESSGEVVQEIGGIKETVQTTIAYKDVMLDIRGGGSIPVRAKYQPIIVTLDGEIFEVTGVFFATAEIGQPVEYDKVVRKYKLELKNIRKFNKQNNNEF